MSKLEKIRACPAAGRDIRSYECTDGRHSRFDCPATCPHDPFGANDYDRVLAIEGALDQKLMDRLRDEWHEDFQQRSEFTRALQSKDMGKVNPIVGWNTYFRRDASGLTLAQRFEREKGAELKNDLRVTLRTRFAMRVTVVETRRILDQQRTEVVDLLDPGQKVCVLRDRTLARSATRFMPFVAWIYPLPHYWRVLGSTCMLPDIARLDPVDIVVEIIKQMDGACDPQGVQLWLAEHFNRFGDAITALGNARYRKMLESTDTMFGKAVYEFRGQSAEGLLRLAQVPEISEEPPSPAERNEGFTAARVWLANLKPSKGVLEVLGRVLIGAKMWRLECGGAARLAALRSRFEALMGGQVRFAGERFDDIGARMKQEIPAFDPALVPPKLLDDITGLSLGFSRVAVSPASANQPRSMAEVMETMDRDFLGDAVPALDGLTPRQAAMDPNHRGKLIQLMKQRIRGNDARNLSEGSRYDANWMLKELGLEEILLDPPPPRPPLEDSNP